MSRRIACVLLLGAGLAAGCQQKTVQESAAAPTRTEDEKAIYAFGAAVGQQVSGQTEQLRLTPAEIEVFNDGLGDALRGEPLEVEISAYESRFQQLAESRMAAAASEAKTRSEEVITAAAAEPGAVKTDSGMVYQTLTPGQGPSPKATDKVRVHYHGTLPDGKVFDSSRERGEPAEFALNQVIACWTEGVQRMKVGEKAKLVCPPAMAYGERGAGNDIPPNSTLVFEVELLKIL